MLKQQYTAVCRWRCALLAFTILCLQGCAVIPPVVDYASMTLSGISFLSTGKGPSDHAISYIAKKDCSLLRLLILKPVCVPVTADTNKSLITRFIDLFRRKQPESESIGDNQVAFDDSGNFGAMANGTSIAANR